MNEVIEGNAMKYHCEYCDIVVEPPDQEPEGRGPRDEWLCRACAAAFEDEPVTAE